MGYYPIFLQLQDRAVLVVGGGREAEHKVMNLLPTGARLTVVYPTLTPQLEAWRDEGRIEHVATPYERGMMRGFMFVMVADDDRSRNAEIFNEGRETGILVNSADDVPNCDFILPAVIRKGLITLAASTEGASPALARRLREELDAYLTEDMPALAELLAEVRTDLRARNVNPDAETWQRAIDEDLRVLLAQRRYRQAKGRLLTSLGVAELFEAEAGAAV